MRWKSMRWKARAAELRGAHNLEQGKKAVQNQISRSASLATKAQSTWGTVNLSRSVCLCAIWRPRTRHHIFC